MEDQKDRGCPKMSKWKCMSIIQYGDDPWALLNATPKEIQEAALLETGFDFSEEEIGDIAALVGALRTLYEAKIVQAPHPDGAQAADTARTIIERWDAPVLTVPRYYSETGLVSTGQSWPDIEKSDLWGLLTNSLRVLINALAEDSTLRLYQCERCGKIGTYRSNRKRRFCGDTCRISFKRQKKSE